MGCVLEMSSFPSSYKESLDHVYLQQNYSAWMAKIVEKKVHPKDCWLSQAHKPYLE